MKMLEIIVKKNGISLALVHYLWKDDVSSS